MTNEWFLAIVPSLLTGIALFIFSRHMSKIDARRAKVDAIKEVEGKLSLDLILASAQLSYLTALAQRSGTLITEELDTAIKADEEALKGYRSFEREQMAKITM